MKCFNSVPQLKLEEGDRNTVFVNLTRGMAFDEKLFNECLTEIKIFDQNDLEIPYEEVAGYSHRAKITSLKRLENQTLTVEYKFQGNMKKIKELFVPETPQKKDSLITIIVSAAGGGTMVVLLALIVAVCVCKRKVSSSKDDKFRTDENHTYGTYARGRRRGCDGSS